MTAPKRSPRQPSPRKPAGAVAAQVLDEATSAVFAVRFDHDAVSDVSFTFLCSDTPIGFGLAAELPS